MAKMLKHLFLTAFLLFLGFSHLLSSTAIPTTRSQLLEYSAPGVLLKGSLDLGNGEEWLVEEERQRYREREVRMDLETTLDYPGTGANKNHDPSPPGSP